MVLKRIMWYRNQDKLTPVRQIGSFLFLEELKPLWIKSGIIIRPPHKCIDLLCDLWKISLNVMLTE